MTVRSVLGSKGHQVISVSPDAKLSAAIKILSERRIGAVMVMSGQKIDGILSERDVVRNLHQHGPELLRRQVGDIMTTVLVSCTPDDAVDDLSALMTNNRVRHVPVLENGRLVGIVSIGDVVKNRMEELQVEHEHLHAYITQGG